MFLELTSQENQNVLLLFAHEHHVCFRTIKMDGASDLGYLLVQLQGKRCGIFGGLFSKWHDMFILNSLPRGGKHVMLDEAMLFSTCTIAGII